MSRHTKIVATLGPASSDLHTLERMAHAGVDVVRMNFSHGKTEEHIARADAIRDASARTGRPIGILADLQGPRSASASSRTAASPSPATRPSCSMRAASWATFSASASTTRTAQGRQGGDVLLLDDGRVKLTVQRVLGHEIHTIVKVGGELSNNKGINRQGGGLTAPALTAKDMDDIRTAALSGGLRRGVLPQERGRHVHGAPAHARGRQRSAA
jgi:pyruvate kinase (EC 2.7.1.40)